MFFGEFDLIENNRGELVAINCETSSVRHLEIFTATRLPSEPRVEIKTYDDSLIVKVSVYLPAKNTTFNVEFTTPRALGGPVGLPDVTDIAMALSNAPIIAAVKFRGTWIACWDVP